MMSNYSIVGLAADLAQLGWTTSTVEFGRQAWRIPTSAGHASILVRTSGNGVVGTFTTVNEFSDDGGAYELEDIVLEVGPMGGVLPVHRPESEVASWLLRYARLLALTTEAADTAE